MSKEVPENLRKLVESTSFFQAEGDAAGYGASPDSTTGFGPTIARGGLPRRYSSGRSTKGFVYRQLQRRGYGRSFTDFKGKKRTPQFQAHPLKDPRRDSDGTINQIQQVVSGVERQRRERAALCRETEREGREAKLSEMNIRRETVAPGEKRSEMEMQKQQMNVRETLSSLDQRKEREREISGDSAREISIEDVRHETTRTGGDSEYPRVTGQKSEMRNEKEKERGV
ncbi:uncharacterized protein MONOS_16306 [Monocercomonoides exilis]|uniref:uncharacterized protein n=1 Tax=Monocercomonoides exilis TaxID=2049356 RepID=UPI003559FA82|nr:hypothetical protein MONOS_16306 [Monocercomonoides exilis]|eukprot:MONOS_16306.1-p1 / transcript=MONOS_16306.1 / gene=MONOS_16306 / organism=Monocercomonoides_exilis_PA203 / gene_product=unspecified product / transcript_product=unspecified product / location=Mono_scaffold01632:4320-5056(-) / protein_length=227 / sequence_SO=supercontig / SO=protein_coding / is_pseudo=false